MKSARVPYQRKKRNIHGMINPAVSDDDEGQRDYNTPYDHDENTPESGGFVDRASEDGKQIMEAQLARLDELVRRRKQMVNKENNLLGDESDNEIEPPDDTPWISRDDYAIHEDTSQPFLSLMDHRLTGFIDTKDDSQSDDARCTRLNVDSSDTQSEDEDEDDGVDWEELIKASRKKPEDRHPILLSAIRGYDSDDNAYDYKNLVKPISQRDALSFALLDIKSSHQVPREANAKYTRLIKAISPVQPFDARASVKHIQKRTGIHFVEYHCCIGSCMCFGPFPNYTHCTHCGEPRLDENGRPRAIFRFIPVIHRLRMQYANTERARKFVGYRASVEARWSESPDGLSEDFWTSGLYQSQKAQGLYADDTDIGFLFSTDGVRVFKTRSNYTVYPLLLLNLNLPPDERVKQRNMLLCGIIPGPKGPKDIDSFIWPLVQEFKFLEKGVSAWDASRSKPFILRAYISLVGADMVAREKLMHMQGS